MHREEVIAAVALDFSPSHQDHDTNTTTNTTTGTRTTPTNPATNQPLAHAFRQCIDEYQRLGKSLRRWHRAHLPHLGSGWNLDKWLQVMCDRSASAAASTASTAGPGGKRNHDHHRHTWNVHITHSLTHSHSEGPGTPSSDAEPIFGRIVLFTDDHAQAQLDEYVASCVCVCVCATPDILL